MSFILLLLLTIFLIARVSHLISSIFWILDHGKAWLRDVQSLSVGRPLKVEDIEHIFEKHEGTKLPWLFVGVKSIRIRKLIENLRKSNRTKLACLVNLGRRIFWQYYSVPIWSSAALIITSASMPLEALEKILLATASFTLLIGAAALLVEAEVSYLTLGSWSSWYHGRGKAQEPTEQGSAGHEFLFALGALIFAVFLPITATHFNIITQFEAVQDSTMESQEALTLALQRSVLLINSSFNADSPLPTHWLTRIAEIATFLIAVLLAIVSFTFSKKFISSKNQ